jgi:mRNA-degrading endonuclease RelE of RelBE toxin-antitoxin system
MRLGEISQFNSERLVLSPTYRLMLTSFGIAWKGFHQVRWGDIRIIYRIEDNRLIVTVIKVGNRRDIYDR